VKTVPYAAIRLAGGILAALWCVYVFSREGSVPTVFLGFIAFTAGWFAAQRFGRPTGLSNRPPWLDTVLPIAIAAFAILPAALYPFLGTVSIAVAAAIIVLFFAGMSLSLGFGPYSNVKVALSTKS
jgi:cell division protein FtsW (lipid II flippase)